MRGRRQLVTALVAALGLHVAVLGLSRFIYGPLVQSRVRAAPRVVEAFEIELGDGTTAADAVRHTGVQQAPAANAPETARFASRAKTAFAPPATMAELGSPEPEPSALAPDTNAAVANTPDATAASKPIDLGLGPDGWQRWMTAPSGEAPPAAATPARKNGYQVFRAAPASTTGGLQEGLEASDRERGLGLGPEGRVLSALQKAAHASVAPEAGVARFEVTVRRTGAVEVTLGASTAQREQWAQVAAHLASDLRSAPPRIPPPREGFRVVVEVVAEQTLPNGRQTKSLKKPHADAPLKFQSTEASVEQTKRENPTIVNPTPDDIALKLDTPGLYVAESNKVCDYRAGAGVIAPGHRLGIAAGPVVRGACDPTNLGAKSQRIVRTRVLAQSVF